MKIKKPETTLFFTLGDNGDCLCACYTSKSNTQAWGSGPVDPQKQFKNGKIARNRTQPFVKHIVTLLGKI